MVNELEFVSRRSAPPAFLKTEAPAKASSDGKTAENLRNLLVHMSAPLEAAGPTQAAVPFDLHFVLEQVSEAVESLNKKLTVTQIKEHGVVYDTKLRKLIVTIEGIERNGRRVVKTSRLDMNNFVKMLFHELKNEIGVRLDHPVDIRLAPRFYE